MDIFSVTSDGRRLILSSVRRKVYPQAIIQRCLVHIKRQVKNYLSDKPKHHTSRELLALSKQITHLETNEQANQCINKFEIWYGENQEFINEKSINELTGRDWLTHKILQLATFLIINSLQNIFAYLQHLQIPYITNPLEVYITHLKEKLTLHRGLRFCAKKNFIKWYLYLKNKESNRFS